MATIKEQQDEFLKRWKHPALIIDAQKEFFDFKQRILNFFLHLDNEDFYLKVGETGYMNRSILKIKKDIFSLYFPHIATNNTYTVNFQINCALDTNSADNFLFNLEYLVNHCLEVYICEKRVHCPFYSALILDAKLLTYLNQCFELSTIDANMIIVDSKQEIQFFPRGDKILDNTLVEEVLPILTDNSEKQYLKALQFYLNKDYDNAANQLRKTLESWLKSILNIDKTLDNIIGNLDNQIKIKLNYKIKNKFGSDKDKVTCQTTYINNFIDETFPTLIDLFKKYEIPHNEGGIKHANRAISNLTDAELEFMLYQTGAIIRFINKILKVEV